MHTLDTDTLKELQAKWGWFFAAGSAMVILGAFAIAYSFVSTIISVLYFGFFIITMGMFEAVQSFHMRKIQRFILHLLLSIFYLTFGSYIVMYPISNAISLTLALAFLFIISGIMKIIFSFAYRIPHAGWVTVDGILTLLLGLLVWQGWPGSSFWVLGLFLGINAIFAGLHLIGFSLAAKNC